MKNLVRALSVVALSIGAALPSICQQTRSVEIPGYLNPKTGAFRPQVARPTPDAAPKVTTYTGTFEFNFTIDLVTAVPSGQEVECDANAELVDLPTTGGFENVITEEASVKATVKGSTATCTVKIPYSWPLESGPDDSVSFNYGISIIPTSVTSESGLVQTRRSSQELAPTAVPKSGTTTTKTIDATI